MSCLRLFEDRVVLTRIRASGPGLVSYSIPAYQGRAEPEQGHSVFVEVLHDRFSEAIKGCVRGGTLLAGHPPRAPQTLTNGGT